MQMKYYCMLIEQIIIIIIIIIWYQVVHGSQITAVLDTAQMLLKLLMQTYKTVKLGNNITCTINCNYRIAAMLYTLKTLFV
jgi:hypothetical protein